MHLITKLLLPFLDVDSMAALLETCKEAHSAFEKVPIPRQLCYNRGLRERLGHVESTIYPSKQIGGIYFTITDSAPLWIRASWPAFFALLLKQYPNIEFMVQDRVTEHCRRCKTCREELDLIRVYLDPATKCFDGQYFYFRVNCDCFCTKRVCCVNCFNIQLKY